jgi:hypothetical protein
MDKSIKGGPKLKLNMQKKIIAIISQIIILTVSVLGTLNFVKANKILKLNQQSLKAKWLRWMPPVFQ